MSKEDTPPPWLGRHWLVDFKRCASMPSEPAVLEEIMVSAAKKSGATVVQSCFHRFAPHGLSGVVIIAESHLAAHTWPEYDSICIDLFSCSETIDAKIAIDFIADQVQAGEIQTQVVNRGRIQQNM